MLFSSSPPSSHLQPVLFCLHRFGWYCSLRGQGLIPGTQGPWNGAMNLQGAWVWQWFVGMFIDALHSQFAMCFRSMFKMPSDVGLWVPLHPYTCHVTLTLTSLVVATLLGDRLSVNKTESWVGLVNPLGSDLTARDYICAWR